MRLLLLLIVPSLSSAEVSFNRDVRPILSKNCLSCHGPDEEDQKGGFALDTFEGITKKNEDGVAGIVVGDPDASEVIKRVSTDDPEELMPPPDHGDSITPDQIKILRQWIKEGAKYEQHWALQKPVSQSLPESDHPNARNVIDHFVAARLGPLDLAPSPAADPRVLMRRLSLDLVGLPPSMEEVETFAADPSEENYEAAIDRYLASPAYGEHMAAMWLDIARYADTVGYAGDEGRDIWPWRDWVIDAFNSNMRYDQFTIEQLAGDLLPDASESQILATAFHRNTLNNNEGGTSDEEFRTVAVKDRISTTVNAWMGLTMRCAECHTHKYDPITHKEYYEFYDFFNQTEDRDQRDDRPRLDIMPKGRESEFAAIREEIEKLKLEQASESGVWRALAPQKVISEGGATATVLEDQSVVFTGRNPEYETTVFHSVTDAESSGLRLELLPARESNDNIGRAAEGGMVLSHFVVSVRNPDGSETIRKLSKATADYSQKNYLIKNVIGDKPHKRGWAVRHPSEGFRARRFAIFNLAEPLPEGSAISVRLVHKAEWPRVNIARLRISTTGKPDPVALFDQKKLDPIGRKIDELRSSLQGPVRVPVMRDRKKPRKTRIMARGSFLQPTEEVSAGVPEALDFFPEGAPKNRLGVAHWIMSPDNPFTARVAVNRLWARLFGMGIVETEEDFGIQGIPPSHPELLDWLALEFKKDWDTKKLLKLMVTSHTYRQSAITSPDRLERDPRNVFLSRGPRFRLSAEVVRDNALAVSGLLSEKRYGPPVYPPNPIKKYVNAFTGGMTWVESKGEDRYRRGLYTFLKRSSPHPLFETFDMATREVCNMRRIRTNTPLQSFMTLNDPAFIEAAQALSRLMIGHSEDLDEQISHGVHRALLRPASPPQVAALKELYVESLVSYEADKKAARKMAGSIPDGGEASQHAAMTVVANVILNQDAFLTK